MLNFCALISVRCTAKVARQMNQFSTPIEINVPGNRRQFCWTLCCLQYELIRIWNCNFLIYTLIFEGLLRCYKINFTIFVKLHEKLNCFFVPAKRQYHPNKYMNAVLLLTSCLLWLILTKWWKVNQKLKRSKHESKTIEKRVAKHFLLHTDHMVFYARTFPTSLTNAADGRCLAWAKAKRKRKIENRFLWQKHKQLWIQTCSKPQDSNPLAYWARTFNALILWPAGSTNRPHLTFVGCLKT